MAERRAYSVSQITAYIRNMFEQDYLLGHIYVQGELSNVKYHSSGILFFTLKDEKSAIAGMMFASSVKKLGIRVQNGQQVVVFGSIRVFERDGKYQLYAADIRDDGSGRLYEQFEALKKELLEMGMFDPQYKKPIPAYVMKLGIVTASTGAALQDMINISRRRNPGIQIILYPARVQGEGAAQSIARGIEVLDRLQPDVIIIGRGGGSIEDLWAFNEETVARAVFACHTPVISAVGHETDTVISDYVADLRAPTPSAAAELAVADVRQTLMRLGHAVAGMQSGMEAVLQRNKSRLTEYSMKLNLLSPAGRVREQRQLLQMKRQALVSCMTQRIRDEKNRLLADMHALEGLSPWRVLRSGYAFVTDIEGRRIRSAGQVSKEDELTIRFGDGTVSAVVTDVGILTEENGE